MKTLPEPLTRRKLPARCASVLMPLVLSVLMTFVVSAISTLKSSERDQHKWSPVLRPVAL